MSNLDLATLLRGKQGARLPAPGLPSIHRPEAIESATALSGRSMDQFCELIRTVGFANGLGDDDSRTVLIGPYPCAIGQQSIPFERVTVSGVENVTAYEIIFPPNADVKNDDRGASPGWFNEWRALTNYSFGLHGKPARVIPTTLESGSGIFYDLAREGVSGGVEPAWPQLPGQTVLDGTSVWRWGGIVSYFEVLGSDPAQSNKTQLVVKVKELTR